MNLPKIPVGERLTRDGRTWIGTPSGPVELNIGSFIPVQSIADRDSLNINTLRQGTWCFVINEDAIYKLIGNVWLSALVSATKQPIIYEQTEPSDLWEIEHNFGYYPDVVLLDSNGYEFKTQIQHISINKVIINLNAPESGRAQLK